MISQFPSFDSLALWMVHRSLMFMTPVVPVSGDLSGLSIQHGATTSYLVGYSVDCCSLDSAV